MLEYGDVFSTTAVSPSSSVWAQDRTVLGTRVLGFSCGPNSAAAAVVTEGIRLAAPGLGAATVERPRLDRDVVRWLRGQSVWFALRMRLLPRDVENDSWCSFACRRSLAQKKTWQSILRELR